MSCLSKLLAACGLEKFEQKFVTAGFSKAADLVELVKDWDTNAEKKDLFNTLCGDQIGLNGMERLKLLKALKSETAVPMEVEEKDDVETTPGKGAAGGEKGEENNMIDLAFLLDTTASMGSYIASAQKNIRDIVAKVKSEQKADVRFSLVSYKDYNRGDTVMKFSNSNGAKFEGTKPVETAGATETKPEEPKPAEDEPGFFGSLLGSVFGGSAKKSVSNAKPKKKMMKARKKKISSRRSGRSPFAGGFGGSGNGFEDGTACRVYDFTANVADMQRFVDEQRATGGGDGPEAVATAMHCAEHLAWREGAAKIAVLIADAPPHGIEQGADDFPEGDPGCRDPLVIARALADKDVTIYTVACEPSVTNSYTFCRDFMDGLAEIGGGMLVPLKNAAMLTQMILASCKEGADLQKIQDEVQKELARLKKEEPTLDEEQLAVRASAAIASRGYRTYQTEDTSAAYAKFDRSNAKMLSADKATLSSLRGKMKRVEAPKGWSDGLETQVLRSSKMSFSAAQCSRMMKKKKRSKGWGF